MWHKFISVISNKYELNRLPTTASNSNENNDETNCESDERHGGQRKY